MFWIKDLEKQTKMNTLPKVGIDSYIKLKGKMKRRTLLSNYTSLIIFEENAITDF